MAEEVETLVKQIREKADDEFQEVFLVFLLFVLTLALT